MEVTTREFYSKSLLAFLLIQKGYSVVVVYGLGDSVRRLPRGLYLINSIYENSYEKLKKIFNFGNIIHLLDEEGIVIRSTAEYLKRLPTRNLKFISKFFCTGQNQFEVLKEGLGYNGGGLVLSGNPRINILDKKFNAIEHRRVVEIKERYGDFVLIVSNFGTVNLWGSEPSLSSRYISKKEIFLKQGLLKDRDSIDDFDKRFEHYEFIFQAFVSFVKKAGQNYKDFNFVVRPHPAEDPEIWKSIGGLFDNVHIVYEGNLTEWIKASRLVIQNGCTSALEALVLSTPCISYRPIVDEKYDQLLPSKLSLNVHDEEELFEKIKVILSNQVFNYSEEATHFHDILNHYVANIEGDLSAQKIINEIESEDIQPFCFDWSKRMELKFLIFAKSKIRDVKIFALRLTLAMMKLFGLRWRRQAFLEIKIASFDKSLSLKRQKKGDLSKKKFEESFECFNEIYASALSVRIDTVGEDIFFLEQG